MFTCVVAPNDGSTLVEMRSLTFDPTVWAVFRSKLSLLKF